MQTFTYAVITIALISTGIHIRSANATKSRLFFIAGGLVGLLTVFSLAMEFFRLKVRAAALIILSIIAAMSVLALTAFAATTISTNIQTDGTLSVTGTSALMGNVGIATSTPAAFLSVQGNGVSDTADFYSDTNPADGIVSILGAVGEPIEEHSGYAAGLALYTHASGNQVYRAPTLYLLKSRGTQSAPTPPQSGDILGYVQYGGYDGTHYFESASIETVASQNWSSGNTGTNLDFYVSANNAETLTSPIVRMDQNGDVGVDEPNPVSNLDVNGNATIGASYSGIHSAPSNGLIIQGDTGVGTSTPIANFQVANGSNATTTVEFGSTGQNKGSCLKLYRTDGSAIYAYVAAGATTFTLSTTACASVSNF